MNTKKKRRVLPFLIKHALLAGTAFISAVILFFVTIDTIVMPIYLKTGQELDAPEFLGKTLTEAQAIARRSNLTIYEEKRDFHTSYPKDTVYLQIPSPGTKVKPGRNMRIFVSLGPRPIPMPDVVGKSPRNARFAIQESGLYIKDEFWIPSNEYPYGTIASQVPEGEQDVPDTTGVILYISNGRKATNAVMPNLLNLSRSSASDTLRMQGFNMALVRVQREEQPNLLPDTVIDQYPGPGRPANTNDEVILIVSTAAKKED